MDLQIDNLGNAALYRPKDQSKFKNRLVLKIESHFPNFFYWLKKRAIKFFIRNN
jgi:transcriptional antiterminator